MLVEAERVHPCQAEVSKLCSASAAHAAAREVSFVRGPASACSSVIVVLQQPGSVQRQTRLAQSRRTGLCSCPDGTDVDALDAEQRIRAWAAPAIRGGTFKPH
jgi:hypothetical protein